MGKVKNLLIKNLFVSFFVAEEKTPNKGLSNPLFRSPLFGSKFKENKCRYRLEKKTKIIVKATK